MERVLVTHAGTAERRSEERGGETMGEGEEEGGEGGRGEEMKTDTATKIILGAIALGLFANALEPLLRPLPVKAGSSFSCTGTLTANAWGGTTSSIGGYGVKVDCQ